MNQNMNKRFYLNSIGPLFIKSLEMFAEKLEDIDGNHIEVDHIRINEKFYAIFKSGTGYTRTSGERIF